MTKKAADATVEVTKKTADATVEATKKAADATVDVTMKAADATVDAGKATAAAASEMGQLMISGIGDTFEKLGASAGFQAVMQGLASELDTSDDALEKMFKDIDADGSGNISDAEMKVRPITASQTNLRLPLPTAHLSLPLLCPTASHPTAFHAHLHLQVAITRMCGQALEDELVEKMMKAADTDNDGEVDIAEFKVIMRAGPEKKESEQGRAGFCGFF